MDLRFTDILGTEHHITITPETIDENFLTSGKYFDGSSIQGWCPINQSDMLLKPQAESFVLDRFALDPTAIIRCDVYDPATGQAYLKCPRALAKRAIQYLQSTGIADSMLVGPEIEFFIFDKVLFGTDMHQSFFSVDSAEGAWNSKTDYPNGNLGYRPAVKGGYFPVPPVDSSQDIRSEMCKQMMKMGLVIEAHHHEVATANQNEICVKYSDLLSKADEVQIYKYVVRNVAQAFGKTATFMPKPLVGDNGSGMHCHQSLTKGGLNLFSGNAYEGLSELALYYIGGIIKHAKTINAFTNPCTNSYRRLVPGFEAPIILAYAGRNRSAAIRIPQTPSKARRIEVRFPDPTANPYLAFSAMLMAGLDGIINKIHPGAPMEENLYDLPATQLNALPHVAQNLEESLTALEKDHQFLLQGNVFNEGLIESYLALKKAEILKLKLHTTPIEFQMYYDK